MRLNTKSQGAETGRERKREFELDQTLFEKEKKKHRKMERRGRD
jgi:hypothetical protein